MKTPQQEAKEPQVWESEQALSVGDASPSAIVFPAEGGATPVPTELSESPERAPTSLPPRHQISGNKKRMPNSSSTTSESKRRVTSTYRKIDDETKLPMIYGQSSYCCGCCGRTNNKRMPGGARVAITAGCFMVFAVGAITLWPWRNGNDGGKAKKYPSRFTTPEFKPSAVPTLFPTKTPEPTDTAPPTLQPSFFVPSAFPTVGPTDSLLANPPGSVVDTLGALEVRTNAQGRAFIYSVKTDEPVQLVGPSMFWSNTGWGGAPYYNRDVVELLATKWNCTVVRAAMGVEDAGGYISDRVANEARVDAVVRAALEFGIYVIIDWHSHYADDSRAQAMSFFTNMVSKFGRYPNTIFELWNEPIVADWEDTVKPYHEDVLEIIRRTGNNNLALLGSPTWTQDIHIASASPLAPSFTNVAYTLHFYAASHAEWLRERVDTALENGVAIFASEWSTVLASGDGNPDIEETKIWLEYLNQHRISSCMWAFNDKNEGASFFKPGTAADPAEWIPSDITDNGRIAIAIFQGTFFRDY